MSEQLPPWVPFTPDKKGSGDGCAADQAETIARVKGTSVNALIVDSLTAEVDRVRADSDFTSRAKKLLARDREIIERLAQ